MHLFKVVDVNAKMVDLFLNLGFQPAPGSKIEAPWLANNSYSKKIVDPNGLIHAENHQLFQLKPFMPLSRNTLVEYPSGNYLFILV